MVVSSIDIEIKGFETASEIVKSETQLFRERNRVIPKSYKINIKVASKSPYDLPEKLFEENVALTLWLGSDHDSEKIPDSTDVESSRKDREKVIREMSRFHEMELESLSYRVRNFDNIADTLSNTSRYLKKEGYSTKEFKLGGTVEEEDFELAVKRLKNRITPSISFNPPEDKPKLKINIEYEPSPENKYGYVLRSAIYNPGHLYSKREIKKVGKEISDILKKCDLPTADSI